MIQKKEKYSIRQLRRFKEMTQEELAFRSGITVRSIAIYEKNPQAIKRASYETVVKIAKALDVKVEQIFLG